MMPSNFTMTHPAARNIPTTADYELSELDEATVALVMADLALRKRVIQLSTHPISGASLRKEIIDLMTDIHRLKKHDREFYYYTPPCETLKNQLHPLQSKRDNVDHIFALMNNTKKEIEEHIGGIKDKMSSRQVEKELDDMLLKFIDETRFYLYEAPLHH